MLNSFYSLFPLVIVGQVIIMVVARNLNLGNKPTGFATKLYNYEERLLSCSNHN